MPKFRKKPVVIEAVQFHGQGHPAVTLAFKNPATGLIVGPATTDPADKVVYAIETLEGWHEVGIGDWIICGVKGEMYPCKPDIFAATYDQVEA